MALPINDQHFPKKVKQNTQLYLKTCGNSVMFSFQNHTEDTLRQELVTLQEEKLNYETTAKVDTY